MRLFPRTASSLLRHRFVVNSFQPPHQPSIDSDSLATQIQAKYPGLPDDVSACLVRTYGVRAWEVLKASPDLHDRIHPDHPYIDAEVVYACREYACTVEDILSRRTRLAYLNRDAALDSIPRVAAIMAKELGWNRSVTNKQIEAARQYVECYGGPTTHMKEAEQPIAA